MAIDRAAQVGAIREYSPIAEVLFQLSGRAGFRGNPTQTNPGASPNAGWAVLATRYGASVVFSATLILLF